MFKSPMHTFIRSVKPKLERGNTARSFNETVVFGFGLVRYSFTRNRISFHSCNSLHNPYVTYKNIAGLRSRGFKFKDFSFTVTFHMCSVFGWISWRKLGMEQLLSVWDFFYFWKEGTCESWQVPAYFPSRSYVSTTCHRKETKCYISVLS